MLPKKGWNIPWPTDGLCVFLPHERADEISKSGTTWAPRRPELSPIGMHTGDERLWDICDKAGTTSQLNAEELTYAEAHLTSEVLDDRANACEAILRCSRLPAQRAAAVRTLEALCLNSTDELYVMTLLTALMYARTTVFSNPVGMRHFVMQSGRSQKNYIRADATDAVWVLAKAGDQEALELLRSLASDEDEGVRGNVFYYLKKLGE
jgi:hypothetical protein